MVKYTFSILPESPGSVGKQYVLSSSDMSSIAAIVDGFMNGRVYAIMIDGAKDETFDPANTLIDALASFTPSGVVQSNEPHLLSILFNIHISRAADKQTERKQLEAYGSKLVRILGAFNYVVTIMEHTSRNDHDKVWVKRLMNYIDRESRSSDIPLEGIRHELAHIEAKHKPGDKRDTVYDEGKLNEQGKSKPLITVLKSFLYKELGCNLEQISVTWNDDPRSTATVDVTIYYEKTTQPEIDALAKHVNDLTKKFTTTHVTSKEGYEQFKHLYDVYYNVNIGNLKVHLRGKVHEKLKEILRKETKARAELEERARISESSASGRERDRDAPSAIRSGSSSEVMILDSKAFNEFTAGTINWYLMELLEKFEKPKSGKSIMPDSTVKMNGPHQAIVNIELNIDNKGDETTLRMFYDTTTLINLAAELSRFKHFKVKLVDGSIIDCHLGEFVVLTKTYTGEPKSEFHVDYLNPGSFSGTELEDLPFIAGYNWKSIPYISFATEKYADVHSPITQKK